MIMIHKYKKRKKGLSHKNSNDDTIYCNKVYQHHQSTKEFFIWIEDVHAYDYVIGSFYICKLPCCNIITSLLNNIERDAEAPNGGATANQKMRKVDFLYGNYPHT